MSTRNISWGYRRPVRRADNLTTFMCRLSWNMGSSTYWNPQGLPRPVMVLIYLYLYYPADSESLYRLSYRGPSQNLRTGIRIATYHTTNSTWRGRRLGRCHGTGQRSVTEHVIMKYNCGCEVGSVTWGDLNWRKWWETGENCVVRNFIIFIAYQILWRW
jgi:hypothetical protein